MRNPRPLAIAGLLCGLAAASAHAAPPPDLDAYVGQAMGAFGAPGLSLAIVENGGTAVAKGYGVRRLGDATAADGHSAFPIGSETKAFTAAALAILVDRGKLSWDDRVVDRLPGFAMYDPYATDHMTVRDLLTHRSGLGLGEGDLLVVPGTNRSRAEIVHALRYLKPVSGFREKFAYDNILYIVAGALVEAVSHQSWEDFVWQNIFAPVAMTDAAFSPDSPKGVALHARTGGPIRGEGPQAVLPEPAGFGVIAPAGGINASAADMARWMSVVLDKGALPDGGRLYSEAQAAELWRPVVVIPPNEFKLPAAMAGMQPDLQDYALGWFVESYRGHIIVEHSGAVFGALAMLYLIPEKNVGIAVAINSEDSATRRVVMFHLLDHYLGLTPTDWISQMKLAREDMLKKARSVLGASSVPAASATAKPALQLATYAGRYVDPWYGSMTISASPEGLRISFDRTPGMEGALEPLGGQRFRTRWRDHNIEDAYIDFTIAGGAPTSATMKAISPLADFSFDYQDLHFDRVSPRCDAMMRAIDRGCYGMTGPKPFCPVAIVIANPPRWRPGGGRRSPSSAGIARRKARPAGRSAGWILRAGAARGAPRHEQSWPGVIARWA